ncbi:hypothetical protein RCL1_002560 [Eukaryota sp. TZLM3-RCL]
MHRVRSVIDLAERELKLSISGTVSSYHCQYDSSQSVVVKFLNTNYLLLSPDQLETIFSQFGTILRLNAEPHSSGEVGKFAPICWIKYEDPRSCILAIENMTGFELENITLLVDHCQDFKPRRRMTTPTPSEQKHKRTHSTDI